MGRGRSYPSPNLVLVEGEVAMNLRAPRSDGCSAHNIRGALPDIRCCRRGLVILSYTIRVAVNLEGDYGKSRKCASAASCGAARSAVARREVRPSDFRDRVAKWFRKIPERKTSNPNYLGSFTTENGEGAKGEMGEGSEGT